ncbi:MAG TPA: AsmA family protein [Syntrophales bacterium]|nr:AsmA family protein [Syntrophales bacterium]
MKSKMKKIVLIPGGITAALVLAAVVFVLTFDINSYKPRIEAAASKSTGMKVRINGKMKLSFFPSAGISIEDILIQNNGADVASAKKAELEIRLLPLLRREMLIKQVRLDTPSFFITKDKSGRFNLERAEKKLAPTGPFEMGKIFIKGGRALYLDEKSGGKVEAKNCDLSIKDLSSEVGDFISTLSFYGYLSCGEVKAQELRISDVRVDMKARGGKFEAAPFTMKIFGGNCRGRSRG